MARNPPEDLLMCCDYYVITMRSKLEFMNKIVKQGNSFCVRIPSSLMKEGSLREGSDIMITIYPEDTMWDYDPESIMQMVRIANAIPEYDNISIEKKWLFLGMHWRWLKRTNLGKNKDAEKKLYKSLKKEYGKKLFDEFRQWIKDFSKKAWTHKENTAILKPKYRHLVRDETMKFM